MMTAWGTVAVLGSEFSSARRDTQDGLRLDFDDESAWLHVRASNTEPILRLIAEAANVNDAVRILDVAEAAINGNAGG